MADIAGGFYEDVVTLPPEHGIRKIGILPGEGEPWVDLWRVFHPPGQSAPPFRRASGTGAKALPTETFWERWITGPLQRGASAIGNFLTAPFRALKTTGLWLGGGFIVVLVVAVVGLVVVLRIVRTVEG